MDLRDSLFNLLIVATYYTYWCHKWGWRKVARRALGVERHDRLFDYLMQVIISGYLALGIALLCSVIIKIAKAL
jgi:hypothetical protein